MTEETFMESEYNQSEQTAKDQILVTGITWNKETFGKYKGKKDFSNKLPAQISLTLPDNIIKFEAEADYYDRIETFVYNLLKSRFNHEAYHCQIWLPLKDESYNV